MHLFIYCLSVSQSIVNLSFYAVFVDILEDRVQANEHIASGCLSDYDTQQISLWGIPMPLNKYLILCYSSSVSVYMKLTSNKC